MQTYQLTLLAQQRPETLERLLRVMRHRGFKVQSLHAEVDELSQKVRLNVSVTSDRAISLLFNQLAKLYDLEQVELLS